MPIALHIAYRLKPLASMAAFNWSLTVLAMKSL